MAITTVDLYFTNNTGSEVGLGGEGEFDNPSPQVGYDFDPVNQVSVVSIDLESVLATNPIFTGSLGSVLQLEIDTGFQTSTSGSLQKKVVEIQMEGSLVTVPNIAGEASALQITAQGTMYATPLMRGDINIFEVQIEASGYFGNNLSMDKEAVVISMEGLIVQSQNEAGEVIVIPAEDDAEYPNISGDEYIVLNLRTKAHSTYRDGERTAFLKTGSLNFGTYTLKSISDLYVLSRAKGAAEVILTTKEDVERHYPLQFGENTQANLKNKKLPVAKGLRGANWTLSIVVPDESHMEIRGIDLFVTDLKRHT